MSDDTELLDDDQFPWGDVEAARNNPRLQRKHPISEGKGQYSSAAKPCPKCSMRAEALIWFYFESPRWTWENLCGRAGWMTVCDPCHLQVDFFGEVLS